MIIEKIVFKGQEIRPMKVIYARKYDAVGLVLFIGISVLARITV